MSNDFRRIDKRKHNEMRRIHFRKEFTRYAEGSVMAEFGNTKVLCNVSVEDGVPPFLKGKGQGWITAEYAMLPRATHTRGRREVVRGKQGGRTMEIQRLIGRSLRAVVDLSMIGEHTLWVDCDVIQADGGTRTTSISGAMVAVYMAIEKMKQYGKISHDINPVKNFISAVSVGIFEGTPVLDLCYEEDCEAEVDMNVVMTDNGEFVEIQGTGEEHTFTAQQLNDMLSLATKGTEDIFNIQKKTLEI
jgi:ribonuclease PH